MSLWQAVLERAIMDFRNGGYRDCRDAGRFLFPDNPVFLGHLRLVCESAGINHEALQVRLRGQGKSMERFRADSLRNAEECRRYARKRGPKPGKRVA